MFENLKVLELASVLAGPSVGQFFAELGAEVIKIENLHTGGDITRTWKGAREQTDDRSAYFCAINWGKKSVALNLADKHDQYVVHELAAQSDVVIASYKPGDAEKLGVAYHQLKTTNPRLIYGHISGYGSHNEQVGYDAVIQAESGFMDLNGEKEGTSLKMPVALIDVLAGHQLKEGLLLALLKRTQTGEGSLVEVSLIQTAISSLVNQASNWLVGKAIPQRNGSWHPNIAPYGEAFETSDKKRLLLAIGSDRQFRDLCEILHTLELANDVRFSTNQKRIENRPALFEILKEKIRLHESGSLLQMIHAKKIPAGLIQNVKEAFEMKEAQALLMYADNLTGVKSFIANVSGNQQPVAFLPPPHFGEHTEEIRERVLQP